MAIVYRFERTTQAYGSIGIFVAGLWLKSKSRCIRDMPGPKHDIPAHEDYRTIRNAIDSEEHNYGFSSLKQAKEVFATDKLFVQLAKRSKVKLLALEIQDGSVIHLNSQCLFRKDQAKLVAKVPLEKLTQ